MDLDKAMAKLMQQPKEKLASGLIGGMIEVQMLKGWRLVALISIVGNVVQYVFSR